MQGATALDNGLSGLVPAPSAGQQDYVLNGSGNWVNPTIVIDSRIHSKAADWFDDDWDNLTNTPAKTIREIAAEEVAGVVDGAPAAFDTLKEIATWIASNPTTGNITGLDNRITSLEGDFSDLEERVSDLEDIVNGTPADIENDIPATPSLLDRINANTTNITNLRTDVTTIQETIKWSTLTETNE